ncbi:LamG-like jellyroll fold domain-containing protein [Aeoliella sp. SH292]|uniref:LamG-like jellyroll fold domain-containing protein n=1 Tax=Aeoliella sp. SH292 TaxID=3454464 RepID=UPI003F963A50
MSRLALALMLQCLWVSVSMASLTDGLQLYSSFDAVDVSGGNPTAGATVRDQGGTTLQYGTVLNTNPAAPLSPAPITLVDSPIGQAISFPGLSGATSTDRSVNYGSVFGIGTGDQSVSFWFNVDTSAPHDQILISHGANGSTAAGWSITAMGLDRIRMVIGPGGTSGENVQRNTADGSLLSNTWYHVALTLGKDENGVGMVTGYLNGDSSVFTGSGGDANNNLAAGYNIVPSASNPLFVGRRGTTNTPTQGMIDDLAIWDRALTASEVQQIYQNGLMGIGLDSTSYSDWISTASSDWGVAEHWSSGMVASSQSNLRFSGNAGAVQSVSIAGAPRTAQVLSFTGPQSSFSIDNLDSTNTLTVSPQFVSTTDVDLSVASGMEVSINGTGYRASNGTEGDFRLAGHSSSNFYVMDIEENSTLNMNATMSQSSASGTTRSTRIVKTGQGTLVFSQPQNLDLRPSGTHHGGYVVDEGTLQYAVDGARGNAAAPVTVNSGATLEFHNAGFWASVATPGVFDAASGNRSLLTINGHGVDGKGAIYNSAGHNTLASGGNTSTAAFGVGIGAGLMFVASDSSIGVAEDTSLTLSHGISAHLGLGNDGNYIEGTPGSLTKVGAGTLVFDANNNSARNGYSGNIIVNEGTFLVTSPTTATTGVTAVRTSGTAQFNLDDVSVAANLRVGQPVTITATNGDSTLVDTAVIAGVVAGSPTIRLSEAIVGGNAGASQDPPVYDTVTLTFGAVPSALNASPVTVNSNGTFGGTGSVLGSTVTVNGGTIAPGTSIGELTVGAMNLGGTLSVEFGNNDIDSLVVAGNLDVTGATFDFSAVGALANGTYEFLSYGSLSGNPASIVFQGLPATLSVIHNAALGTFSLVGSSGGELIGDYNGDGFVNLADYTVWRDTLGATGAGLAADANGDQIVDGLDYGLWKSNFGRSSGSVSALAGNAVPEPSTMLMTGLVLLTAVAASGALRRRC